ncbi:FG-GAP-like repeat-containing protein [Tautonia sociabilis]|uniref:Thioredoxin n=1 Tax=Tautonia sociabilis TaxID=2080755 RepID=A0A432MEU5_9BACT|nr:FG-GAP-like repeat-containing protein [Tautonia sociabilis]RUL84200.1 thioredoxin [Tautonia sociabilis]
MTLRTDVNPGRPRRIAMAALGLLAGAALVGGWLARREADRRWVEGRLAEAGEAVADGRFATARALLEELAEERPGSGEAPFMLGLCELAMGRRNRALEAFSRVPPDSPRAFEAAVHRGRLLLEDGRLSAVEEAITPEMPARGGPIAGEALRLLATVYEMEGRLVEARQLHRRAFGRVGDPVSAIRRASGLNDRVVIGSARAQLGRSLEAHPEDDRVWLAMAYLETTTGRLDEADRWLSRCERARPDDPAVRKARLRWARASDDPDAARDAIRLLDDGELPPGEVLELASWFARHRGDPRREREALEAALEAGGADPPAILGRLAALAAEAGENDDASHYRQRQVAFERDLRRYAELTFGPDPIEHSRELSRLALGLGRTWEALAWEFLDGKNALPPDPDVGSPGGGPTLADLREELALAVPDGPGAPGRPDRGGSEPSRPTFREIAAEVGLSFSYDPGRLSPGRTVAEMMGGGVALIDFDGDGWLDVFLPQGGTFPPPEGSPNADRLFRNRGDGTFEDATRSAGLDRLPGGYGFGATAGDADGDGWPDLLISRWRGLQLFRNRGNGTFEDATRTSGLDAEIDWPTSAAFADLDADGDLDLYVCQYLELDPDAPPFHDEGEISSGSYANPLRYSPLPDRLYRKDGGRFVDVSEASGIAAVDPIGRGLGVVAGDFDGDGLLDLFVANDLSANLLFRNRGGLRFEEIGERAGISAGAEGIYQGSMGIAPGDLDGDGLPDLAVTNYLAEGMAFYRNLGGGLFAEQGSEIGLRTPTRYVLGFGTLLLDANADGLPDLAATNGHVFDGRPRLPFAMPSQLLLGTDSGRLIDVTEHLGSGWTLPRVGRGLAVGDLDNDTLPDVLIVAQDAPLAYLHNESESGSIGRSLVLRLEATATAPSAEGARVTLWAGGRRQVAWTFGGGSYLSSSDPRLHFGIGAADLVDDLEIRWPSGLVDRFSDLPADSSWLLREGDPTPLPIPASPPGKGDRDR